MSKIQNYLHNILKTNSKFNALISHTPAHNLSHSPENALAVVIKDNFVTKALPTTCASKALEGYTSPYESTCSDLLQQAGMVMMGKANMDEFAMGSNNQYTHYGAVVNPAFPDEERSPGGSSGGSAAAVAAGFCDVATGTDTGGSVRLPGAYCSVIGFKPTYGRISRHGVVSYAQSLDTVGLLAREWDPLRRVFRVLDVHDHKDPTNLNTEQRALLPKKRLTSSMRLNIGVVNEANIDMDESVRQEWIASLQYLENLGHKIHFVDVPMFKYALHTYFMLAPAEASSNLARYDGVRYGFRAEEDQDADGLLYAATRTGGLGAEVRRRILLGTYNLNSSAFEENFRKAQQARRKLTDELTSLFSSPHYTSTNAETGDIDVLIHPTGRSIPPKLENIQHTDPVDDYVNDIFTIPANLAGIPAVSVPTPLTGVGMQVWGQFGDDELVLDVGELLHQRVTP